ncbi:hypothetical protein GCM10010264_18510 [Streptomyces globisporus]|nr:hypothetical protein GCM10010264_18510 [Streptomyces globisporus]
MFFAAGRYGTGSVPVDRPDTATAAETPAAAGRQGVVFPGSAAGPAGTGAAAGPAADTGSEADGATAGACKAAVSSRGTGMLAG